MIDIDPLEGWLSTPLGELSPQRIRELQTEAHEGLETLAAYLDNPPRRPDLRDGMRGLFWLRYSPAGFASADVPRAQAVYRRIFEMGGAGSMDAQRAVLTLLGGSADPQTVPFWLEMVDLTKPRDKFRQERVTLSLAALALIAIRRDEAAAYDALHQLTRHANPAIRAQAVLYLRHAYADAGRPVPEAVLTDMFLVATQDKAFEPRFQARRLLRVSGQPVPLDNPGGVYDFKVMMLRNKRIYRTITARSEQTLADLQRFIQHAFAWDNDHLYCFYMNGRKYDDHYQFACAYEEDRPPWASEAVIGELGLVKKHRFLYHFDYGDDHLFEVEVVDIRPDVREGNYPRLIDSHGKAPAQYY
ncbi:MAG TPA: plasmid pRiA4b ORF-3 family protein [Anaerolineae bacterium]|nr:plasmid pRiA4b ORF-3 family protein [Anaerolineae bacterium]